MFNTFKVRLTVAAAWLVVVGLLWWGYGRLLDRYPLQQHMAALQQALMRKDWAAIRLESAVLERGWQSARPVVELNFGGGLLESFESGLARVRGSVEAGDATLLRVHLAELMVNWRALRSPYPDGK